MAASIKGITIEIGANTTGLGKALEDVNKKSRSLQSELRQVDALLKLNPGNAELVAQKQELLAKAVANAKEKHDTLRAAQSQVEQQFAAGKISDELGKLAAEANELGVVLSDDSVTALGEFDDKMQRLQATGAALSRTLGAAVAPALGVFADNLRMVGASVTEAIQTGDWDKVGDGISAMLLDIGGWIADALPRLAEQGAKIIGVLAKAVVGSLPQVLPALLSAALGVFESILGAITGNAAALAKMAVDMLSQLAVAILTSLPLIIAAGIEILIALIDGIAQSIPQLIPAVVAAITQILQTVILNLPLIIQAGLRLILALVQGIMDNLPVLITSIINMIPCWCRRSWTACRSSLRRVYRYCWQL